MTPTELRNAMGQLGIRAAGLAKLLRLGKHGRVTVYRWMNGKRDIPSYLDMIIESYTEYDGQLPDIEDFR